MKLVLITAGETAYTKSDAFLVATEDGKVLGRFETEEEAEQFMEERKEE